MQAMVKSLLFIALAVSPAQLIAQTYIPKPYYPRDVAGWTISSVGDEFGSCLMTMSYEGVPSTRLTLGIDHEGSPTLMLSNDEWTVKPDEKYRLDYFLSGGGYKDHPTLGLENGSFVTKFEKPFVEYFSKSTFLDIYRGDVLVDKLDLKGSSAAIAEVTRCVAHIQREADAINRERKKFEHIPSNPFAD